MNLKLISNYEICILLHVIDLNINYVKHYKHISIDTVIFNAWLYLSISNKIKELINLILNRVTLMKSSASS